MNPLSFPLFAEQKGGRCGAPLEHQGGGTPASPPLLRQQRGKDLVGAVREPPLLAETAAPRNF